MQRFEYKVIPAPKKGEKARGVRTTEDRFALALTHVMNDLGAEGWDYVRADALPCDERVGLTGSRTVFLNVLVFRRAIAGPGDAAESRPSLLLTSDMPTAPAPRLGPAETHVTGSAPAVGPAVSPHDAGLAPDRATV
jgi:hypothetical protein